MDTNYWIDRIAQCTTQYDLNQVRYMLNATALTPKQKKIFRAEIKDQSIRIANGQYLERELGGAELCDQEMSIWANNTPEAPFCRIFLDWQPNKEQDGTSWYEDSEDWKAFATDKEKSETYRQRGVKTLLEVCKAYRKRDKTLIGKRFKQLAAVTPKGHWAKELLRKGKQPTFAQFLKLFSRRLGALKKTEAITTGDWWRLARTTTKIFKYLGYETRPTMDEPPPTVEQKHDAMNFLTNFDGEVEFFPSPEEQVIGLEEFHGTE